MANDPLSAHRGRLGATVGFVLLVLAALLAPVARAAPGALDPTFGAGGSERLFDGAFFSSVATQPDGKIVMVGTNWSDKVLIARLLEDGSPDPSFGKGGLVESTLTTVTTPTANAVAVQPDGKIVVVGSAELAGREDFFIARYLSNGHPDRDFAGAGLEAFQVGSGSSEARAVAIGADGRILVTGGANGDAGVAVMLSDGEADSSFSGDGVTTFESPLGNGSGSDIAETPDGGIVLADSSGAGRGQGFTIAKLLRSGLPDPRFGESGFVLTPIPKADSGRISSLAVTADGRIVAVGSGYDEAGFDGEATFAAARYLANGELDPTFGAGTGIFTDRLTEYRESPGFVSVTAGGKVILAGGYETITSSLSPAALRLNPDGSLDPSFGDGGAVVHPAPSTFDDAALDSRGRLVIISAVAENNVFKTEIIRILGDPPVPGPPALAAPIVAGPMTPRTPPRTRIGVIPASLPAAKLKRFAGSAVDLEGKPLAKVQVALVRAAPRKSRADASAAQRGSGRKACLDLQNAKGGFKKVSTRKGEPCPLTWLEAKGTADWTFEFGVTLPAGNYVLYARAIDADGSTASSFSRAAGNRVAFRLTAE